MKRIMKLLTAVCGLTLTTSLMAANVAKIARIGDTKYYTTIGAAIEAAGANDVVELIADVNVNGYFVYNKSYTLDGNGHTIKCDSPNTKYWRYFVNANGSETTVIQTFKNVTIDANGQVPYVMQSIDGGKLILENVTLKGARTKTVGSWFSRSTALGYGIHINDGSVEATNLTVSDCEVSDVYLDGDFSSFTLAGDNCNIDVVGSSSDNETVTSKAKGYYAYEVTYDGNIKDGVTKTISNRSWNGIIDQVQQAATAIVMTLPVTVKINSVSIKLLQDVTLSETFISNDTKLTIDGNGKTITGTIKFTSSLSPISNVVLGDGSTLDCTGSITTGFSNVSVAANTGINIILPSTAKIASYTLPVALGTDATATISVGDVKYIAKNGVIAPAETVAQIGDAKYSTLQAAIDAAASGATIHVLKDVALTSSLKVASGKTLTLNLAGRKITVSGADYALVNNGTLTIVDKALVSLVPETAAQDDEDVTPIVIAGVRANDGVMTFAEDSTGSIAGVQNNGALAVESGTIEATSSSVAAIDNTSSGTTSITGGSVQGMVTSASTESVTITGGTFSSDISDFLDKNYGVNDDGAVVSYAAKIGETKYETLEDAFGAAKEYDVVTILDNTADISGIASYVAEGLFPISNGDGTYTVRTAPDATVKKLPAFTLKAEDEYLCWPEGDTEVNRPLDIVMNFVANDDGKSEANATGFADWTCDFYLTLTGMAGDSIVADGCYLAGNYGEFGWIVIPVDGETLNNGKTYPVVSGYDAHITYRQICADVKKFTAAIHVDEAIMEANPDLKINLALKMTNDKDPDQELVVGSYDYTVDDLKRIYNPPVEVAEGVTVEDAFKTTVADALANAYQKTEGNFDITVEAKGDSFATIDVSAKEGFEFPAEGLEMTFPAEGVANGETAFIVHKHGDKHYVYSAVCEYGFVTFNNTLGFSDFTVGDESAIVAAIADVQAGDTVTLLADIALTEIIVLDKAITLDGNGYTLTSTAGRAINVKCTDEVTIKNLTIETATNCERAINIIEAAGTTNIENVTISGDSVLKFAVNMANNLPAGAVVNIKNSDLSAWKVIQEYASGSTLNIEDSKLTGWAAIDILGSNTTINVENSELVGINTYPEDQTQNTYSTIAVGRNTKNVAINVTGGSITAQSEAGKATQRVYGYNENCSITAVLDTEFILVGDNAEYLNIDLVSSSLSVPAEYADVVNGAGYATVATDNGMVSVVAPVAQIGEVKYATLKEAFTAAAAAKGATIDLLESEYDGSLTMDTATDVVLNEGTYTLTGGKGVLLPAELFLRSTDATKPVKLVIAEGAHVTIPKLTLRDNAELEITKARLDSVAFEGGSAYLSVYNNAKLTATEAVIGYNPVKTGSADPVNTVVGMYNNWGYRISVYGTATFDNSKVYAYVGQADNCGFDVLGSGSVTATGSTIYTALFKVGEAYSSKYLDSAADTTALTATLALKGTTVENIMYRGDYTNNNGMRIGNSADATVKGVVTITDSTVDFTKIVYGDSRELGLKVQNANSSVTIANSTVKFPNGANVGTINVTDSTVELAKFDNDYLMFISGENTVKIADATGSSYAVRVNNGAVLNNSYIKSTDNMTTRFLGSATLNGGYECAFLQGGNASQGGVGGTLTIEEGTTVKVSYAVDFGHNYVIDGGTIELSGGNASGEIWGCVFQDGEFTVNADIIVDGGTDTAPIHFTNAKATVNGSITQSDSKGEPIYIGGSSNVTFAKDSQITTDCSVHVSGNLTSEGNVSGTITKAADAAIIAISGGTYTMDVSDWCVEGYAALKNLDGNYVVGEKPTATVNDLGAMTIAESDYMVYNGSKDGDMPLSFVMQFLADQDAEDMKTSPYADWYGDFVLTFEGLEDGGFVADGCYLAGYYGDFGWVKVPVDGMEIEEGARYPVMLGVGMGQKYDYICSDVKDFRCALYLTPAILEANPNLKVKLELSIVDNSKGEDEARDALANTSLEFVNVVGATEYKAEDFASYVAQIGETKYTSLQDAIDAAGSNPVTILNPKAISENEPLVVAKTGGKEVSGQKAAEAAKVLGGVFTVVEGTLVYDYDLGVQAVTFSADKFVMTIGLTEGDAKVTREFTDRWVVVSVDETEVASCELKEIVEGIATVKLDKDTILDPTAPPSGSTTKRISFKIVDEKPKSEKPTL